MENGSVRGYGSVGGLVGHIGWEQAEVERCYADASVYGSRYVGGLVGAAISDFSSTVKESYSSGIVRGISDSTGGLIGRNSGLISECYSVAAVLPVGTYLGGLVGYDYESSGTIENSFFLDPNDGGGPDNGIGEPLTNIEMKQQVSFVNWDFIGPADGPNDIWSICEAMNYPRLVWSIPAVDFLCPDGVDFIDYSYLAERWLMVDYGDVNGMEVSGDGVVSYLDFAEFSLWWGQTACGNCGGFDYSGDGDIGWADLAEFCDYWLMTDYGDVEGAELTGDGVVDWEDLQAFCEEWLGGK